MAKTGNSCFRLIDLRIFFLEINQLETGIACGGHVIEDLPYIVPTKLRFIWLSSFRKEDFV
jgi:hypothetical protein